MYDVLWSAGSLTVAHYLSFARGNMMDLLKHLLTCLSAASLSSPLPAA